MISFFGEKDIERKGISNKIIKKAYSEAVSMIHIIDEEKEDIEKFETLTDFHHYFTSFNA